MATQDKENGNGSAQDAQSCQSSDADKKNKFPGFNLYVKNLDDSFTDATLREAFDEFGTITSAKVMCDATGISRGFGFVCFTTQAEADKARTKMNGRIVGTKPLYVSMAQRKEERKQYLSDKYKNAITSSLPVSPPLPTQQHSQPVQIADLPPSQIQYLPNNAAIPGAVQYRYLPQESQWQTTGTPYVVQPSQPGFGAPLAVMSYQPLLLVPGINMMAPVPPPPPMPILHQPIYIHSTKTNTLIYSTSVQANSHQPQVVTPVYCSVGNDAASVPAPYQDAPSPHPSPHFKPSPNSVHHVETVPTSSNTEDVSQQNGNMLGKVGPMQIPGNAAFQFQAHSNNNFAT